jgi:hypothetical protein
MQTRLLEHLYEYNTLSSEQYSFQPKPNLNTDNATYQLTNDILNALNIQTLIGGIFVILKRHLIVLIIKLYYLN